MTLKDFLIQNKTWFYPLENFDPLMNKLYPKLLPTADPPDSVASMKILRKSKVYGPETVARML